MDPSSGTDMFTQQLWLVIGYLVTLLGSAYFSAAENAFSAANKIRLKNLSEDGNRRAKIALSLVENFEQVLSTILIGLNVLLILGASFATKFAFNAFGRDASYETLAATLATVISAILVYFLADMLPKSFAIARPDAFAIALAPSMRVLSYLLFPLTILVKGFSNLMKKISRTKDEPTITEDEISDLIDVAEEEGVVDEEQSDLLQSALEFSETTIADVITLKEDVIGIEVHIPKEEVAKFLISQRHSRYPVYDTDFDHIVGVLQTNSFLRSYIKKEKKSLKALCTPVFYTTLDAEIQELIGKMSSKKTTMAIVQAEGHFVGLATIEDFVEELVGEIYDESDVVNDRFMKLGGDYFKVKSTCTMGELFREMDYHGKVNMSRLKTVNTFVLEQLGHAPEEDEVFEWRDLTITITDVEDGKLQYVEMKRANAMLDAVTSEKDDEEESDS